MTSTSDSPVLVIGGRGFVGAHVTEALIASGRPVHLFGPAMEDDLLAPLAGRFTETVGSITDRAALADVLADSGAREVVTMAAHSAGRVGLMRSGEAEADKAMAVNVDGFRLLCEAAREAGVTRLVWTSSTVVYGDAADYPAGPVDEDAPCRPRTFYGLTKQLAEAVAGHHRRVHGLPVTGLRLPLVLGPKLWYAGAAAAILEAAAAAREGRAHRVAFHDDPMDLMHVTDCARAVLACLDHPEPPGEIYNLTGFTARMSELLAGLAARAPGWRAEHEITPAARDFPPVSAARIRADLGFAPRHDLDAVLDGLMQTKETA
ncbi:NAD-dependent epimerase/dehydratase family protein [Oceanicola granulosus HTCC2516]|uniref:NAD-dependent epimerase/dehydratase family protein n=1 Tax=Oceanicola granulosus (strain ATCC BAA-861 / DSM 15982 / KCTC 12143 / HTCC2516) TaxID=314256 RepID=Q2CC35_OCEGH|nr:NAD(P)-dependent oxidoreductase [Oceanicola granulosus]EAR50246.1 NAD-dependent epimerase/dehydratase family protein [Oceanicola granulosus HTCC2516]